MGDDQCELYSHWLEVLWFKYRAPRPLYPGPDRSESQADQQNIIRSSPCLEPTSERGLPAPLLPLKPVPIKPNIAPSARLRPLPAVDLRKAAKKKSDRDWQEVQVPLVLPPSHEGWRTGWEDLGVVESLRMLAGLDEVTDGRNSSGSNIQPGLAESTPARASPFPPPLPLARHLPSFSSLPPHIRLLLPHRRLPPIPRLQAHPSPPAAHTRPNPRTWGPVRAFRPRLIRRAYKRLWESLTWARPVLAQREGGEKWKKVSWEELLLEERSGEGESEGDTAKKAKKGPKEKKEWKGRKKQDHPPKNQL